MNPYAPPETLETEATPSVYWRCFGERVMARDGAVLPKVDLETGVSEGEMLAVPRSYQTTSLRWVPILVIVIYLILGEVLSNFVLFLTIFAVIFIVRIIPALRGKKAGTIQIFEYRETSRHQHYLTHQRWRHGIYYTTVLLFILAMAFGDKITSFSPMFPAISFMAFMTILLATSLWKWVERPKTRTESTPPLGWLRIRNVHPEAMRKLREIEVAEQAKLAVSPAGRTRRIFTRYFHRLPLAVLLGNRQKNLFHSAIITLMKLLRSSKLERETYHFDETFEISESEISPPLRSSLEAWRLAHPDWKLVKIERLPSPAGDLTMDAVFLASPLLEHVLTFSHTTSAQNLAAHVECEFLTSLQPSGRIHTSSMPVFEIGRTDVDSAQAKGSHLQIFETHLARCAQHPLAPAIDLPTLLARLHEEKAEAHALLEAAAYQGPTREISI